MNYRHAYHAGNFADVIKHAALAYLLDLIAAKPKPFVMLDTHAGIGQYDLASIEAFKTGEARTGIERIWPERHLAPPELNPYFACLAGLNPGRDQLLFYPGSPLIARAAMRSDDRMTLIERHPDDALVLGRNFQNDAQVRVEEADGWTALKARLPPALRRGLVLIDPPFEEPDEFARLLQGLKDGYRRFATGVFVAWYPIKDEGAVGQFKAQLTQSGIERILSLECRIALPEAVKGVWGPGLHGTGMIIINPTWPFAEQFGPAAEWLTERLARGPGARAELTWLAA